MTHKLLCPVTFNARAVIKELNKKIFSYTKWSEIQVTES